MTAREIEDPKESSTPVQRDSPQGAWLDTGWNKFPIHGGCSIGRSPQNAVVLDSPKVSRRHAIINVQNVGEFWLIDLGSSNGTFHFVPDSRACSYILSAIVNHP